MASTFTFYEVFDYFQEVGVYDFILPFLLVFAIMFSVLDKSKILGKERTGINALIAFIAAMIVIVNTEIVFYMNMYLSKMTLFIVIVLFFLIVFGLFGHEGKFSKGWLVACFIVSIFAVVWALTPTFGLELWPWWWRSYSMEEAAPIIIFVVFIIVVIFIVSSGTKKDSEKGFGGTMREFVKGLNGEK